MALRPCPSRTCRRKRLKDSKTLKRERERENAKAFAERTRKTLNAKGHKYLANKMCDSANSRIWSAIVAPALCCKRRSKFYRAKAEICMPLFLCLPRPFHSPPCQTLMIVCCSPPHSSLSCLTMLKSLTLSTPLSAPNTKTLDSRSPALEALHCELAQIWLGLWF